VLRHFPGPQEVCRGSTPEGLGPMVSRVLLFEKPMICFMNSHFCMMSQFDCQFQTSKTSLRRHVGTAILLHGLHGSELYLMKSWFGGLACPGTFFEGGKANALPCTRGINIESEEKNLVKNR
jgi:hypothetical protein